VGIGRQGGGDEFGDGGGDFVRWSSALLAVADSCTDQGAAASGSGFPSSDVPPPYLLSVTPRAYLPAA
jgi:hypothetical protein